MQHEVLHGVRVEIKLSAVVMFARPRSERNINELKGASVSLMCVFLSMTACTEGAGCGFDTMFIFLVQLPMKPPTNPRE